MDSRPAIVVLARRSVGSPLRDAVTHAIQAGWRVVVVTTAGQRALLARWVAGRDLVSLTDEELERGQGYALARGVAAQVDAGGWLMLPDDAAQVRPETLVAVGEALKDHPVAYAQYRGRRGYPIGFAAELVSDLVALQGEDGAQRLLGRYPARGIEVDDPGVLAQAVPAAGLAASRAGGAA
jgi:molybdenum cofactor cytidylyltransferase